MRKGGVSCFNQEGGCSADDLRKCGMDEYAVIKSFIIFFRDLFSFQVHSPEKHMY